MTRRIRIGGADLDGGDSRFEEQSAAEFIVRDDTDPTYRNALAETIAEGGMASWVGDIKEGERNVAS